MASNSTVYLFDSLEKVYIKTRTEPSDGSIQNGTPCGQTHDYTCLSPERQAMSCLASLETSHAFILPRIYLVLFKNKNEMDTANKHLRVAPFLGNCTYTITSGVCVLFILVPDLLNTVDIPQGSRRERFHSCFSTSFGEICITAGVRTARLGVAKPSKGKRE